MLKRVLEVVITEMTKTRGVKKEAIKFGLKTTDDLDSTEGWDFEDVRHWQLAMKYVLENKPGLIIGSSMNSVMAELQDMMKRPSRVQEQYQKEVRHTGFLISLYRAQIKEKRLFVHESQTEGKTWSLETIRNLMKESRVYEVIADQSMFGLNTKARWRND